MPVSVFTTSKYTTFYQISPSSSFVTEGGDVVFNIETLNLGAGTVLYYTTEVITGNIDQSDFDTPISGEVIINNDSAALTVTANADFNTAFEGEEIFRIQLRRGSTSGTVLATSANVAIVDTSNAITFGVFASSTAQYYDPSDPGV